MNFIIHIVLHLCVAIVANALLPSPKILKNPRVVGGEPARAGQFPWMCSIYKTTSTGRYFCAGTLLSNQWVITVAQCVIDSTELVLNFGSNSLNGDDTNRLTVATDEYIIHENFNATSLWFDIAMIKLRLPITFTDYIQPIVYPGFGYLYPDKKLDMPGWGQISDSEAGLVNELRFVEVSIVDQHECQTYYGDALWTGFICAEGNYNEGFCFGDVGGALISPAIIGNHSVAVAIASFISSNGCESLDPNGFTRVDAFENWITQVMRNNTI